MGVFGLQLREMWERIYMNKYGTAGVFAGVFVQKLEVPQKLYHIECPL